MCDPITIIGDALATVTGNPELIPLINAGISTGEGLASGKGFGKSLLGGLESGGEALVGQEVGGALGFGGGNSLFNDTLGISTTPASTGLPDIGGGLNDALGGVGKSLGLGGSPSPVGSGAAASPTVTAGSAPSAAGSGAGVGGASGGAGAISAPASVASADPTSFGSSLSGGSSVSGGASSGGIGDFLKQLNPFGGGSSSVSGAGSVSGGSNISGASAPASTAGGAPNYGGSLAGVTPPSSSGGVGNFLSKNASWIAPAGALGYQAIKGEQPLPGQAALEGQAAQLGTQGKQLSGYLKSGTLPPGVQTSLDEAANSAKASIRSQYASRGMSGSSAEAQDLAGVDRQISVEGANIATNLLQQGVQETGLSAQIYQQLMQDQLKADEGLGSAISGFASSLSGGRSAPAGA